MGHVLKRKTANIRAEVRKTHLCECKAKSKNTENIRATGEIKERK